jgi:hypothetical protein
MLTQDQQAKIADTQTLGTDHNKKDGARTFYQNALWSE